MLVSTILNKQFLLVRAIGSTAGKSLSPEFGTEPPELLRAPHQATVVALGQAGFEHSMYRKTGGS